MKKNNYTIKYNKESCWVWFKGLNKDGYGVLGNRMAHRVVYEAILKPIPQGLVIDHLCRNRKCVNPSHMEVVTIKENVMRGNGICALNSRKKSCRLGHRYEIDGRGQRFCRICKNTKKRLRRSQRRESG